MLVSLTDEQVATLKEALDDAWYYRADDAESLEDAGDDDDAREKREQCERYRELQQHLDGAA